MVAHIERPPLFKVSGFAPVMGQKLFEISETHAEFRKLYLADFTPNIENSSTLIG